MMVWVIFLATLCLTNCGTVQHAVQKEIVQASVSQGRLSGQELTACTAALRQAGHKDVLRVMGGTSAYNHYTDELQYYPQFTLARGGWGTAKIKVTGSKQNPELLVLDVQRYDRQKR